ncbi:MAG TPA: hypothetical protein VFM20_01915 [Nitrososphaeraceae archaeon]|nr:hypothetical protein [Nitrososphaeraceae archaeon]
MLPSIKRPFGSLKAKTDGRQRESNGAQIIGLPPVCQDSCELVILSRNVIKIFG